MIDGEVPDKNNSNRKNLGQVKVNFPSVTEEVNDQRIDAQTNDAEKGILKELFGDLWIVVGKGPNSIETIITHHSKIKTTGIGKEFIRV